MPQFVCDNCGTTVRDEQFCPNCGAWIDPMQEVVEEAAAGDDEFEEFELGEPPPPPPDGEEPPEPTRVPRNQTPCPSCGSLNPSTNRHCEECGARLSQGPLPVAPRPAVQATAGVRAAMAIASLLLGVVVVAVLFNIFTGDDGAADDGAAATSTTTSTTAPPESAPLPVLDVSCTVDGISGFPCDNLIDDGDGEYQIGWESLEEDQVVAMEFIFPERTVVTGILWENLPQGDRFFQNYRVAAISVEDGSANSVPVPISLEDQPGSQPLDYVSLPTLSLTITVETAFDAQERNGNIYTELAILQVTPIGYPAAQVEGTTTTTTGETTTGG